MQWGEELEKRGKREEKGEGRREGREGEGEKGKGKSGIGRGGEERGGGEGR